MPQQQQLLNIVVLGGSYAGLSVAHQFLDNIIHELSTFEGAPTYRIILVNPSTHLYWNICAPRALVSPDLIDLEDVFVPIEPAYSRHPFNEFTFMQGWATEVDTGARKVSVGLVKNNSTKRISGLSKASLSTAPPESPTVPNFTGSRSNLEDRHARTKTISYHALIIATGTSSHSPQYTLHGTHEETLAELRDFHRKLELAHSLVIVGGGPSGVETAGQIATYYNRKKRWSSRPERFRQRSGSDTYALGRTTRPPNGKSHSNISGSERVAIPRERELERRKCDSGISAQSTAPLPTIQGIPSMLDPDASRTPKIITLLSGGTRVLSGLPPAVSEKAERKLKKLGVHVVHNLRETSHTTNESGTLTNCHLNNDMTITSDLFISATGVVPSTKFLPKTILDDAGYVRADRETLRVYGHGIGERVYSIGDCASYSRNYLSDIHNALPVLMRNLHNDLLAHEYRLQTVQAAPESEDLARAVPKMGFEAGDRWEYESLQKTMSGGRRPCARPANPTLPGSHLSPTEHQPKPHLSFPASPLPSSKPKNTSKSDNSKRPGDIIVPPTQHPIRAPLLTPIQAHYKITTLEDAKYIPKERETVLVPITRYGGTGVIGRCRVPGFIVHLLKGRGYGVKKAKAVVEGRAKA